MQLLRGLSRAVIVPPFRGAAFAWNDQDGQFRVHDSTLATLGALAERYFRDGPPTCLIKLKQLAELLSNLAAAHPSTMNDVRALGPS
jgi:hypothetical protein